MKKILVVGALIVSMAVGTFAVYADSADTSSSEFGRGFGHMGGKGFHQMKVNDFDGRIDLTEEEKEELLEKRNEWFENRRELFDNQDNLTDEEKAELFKERQEEREKYREERILTALENGTITEEEASEWRAHFEEMDKFHQENGFLGGRMARGSRRGNRMMGGCGY